MDQDAGEAERKKSCDLKQGWNEMELFCSVRHSGYSKSGICESAKVYLAQRHDEAGIDGEQQKKIEFTGADQFGQIRAIDEEESLEHLLDKIASPDQQDHLPLGPAPDIVGMQIEHPDKTELQPEPEQFDEDPQQEIAFESHFPRHRIFPEGGIDSEVTQGRVA